MTTDQSSQLLDRSSVRAVGVSSRAAVQIVTARRCTRAADGQYRSGSHSSFVVAAAESVQQRNVLIDRKVALYKV